MKQNRLGIATAILVVLVGLTAWRLSARKAEDAPAAKAEIELPKIKSDTIDALELTAPERGTVRLVKQGEDWRVAEPVDAKADQDAVKTALTKLEELELTGVAATKAKNHERLEVDEAKGTRVMAKTGDTVVFDGYVGVFQAGNSMLRLNGQEPVATVKGSIRYAFNKQVREWRDRTVTKVEPSDVQRAVFENGNGRFEFVRDGEDWKQVVAGRQKPIEPLDTSKVKGLVGTAASLNATDFAAPEVTAEQAGLGDGAPMATLTLGGEQGEQQIVYRVGSQQENNYYLQREGDPTIYLVSSWIGGRLTPSADTFIKKEAEEGAPQAAAAHGEPRLGSRENPIQVEPVKREIVDEAAAKKPAAAAKAAKQ